MPASASLQAGPPNSSAVEIPDTPAGKPFRAWLESFNSGDREKILSFQSHLPAAPDPEKRVNRALGLRQQTGGFELRKIESSTANQITGVVKEKNSENLARFELTLSDADPSRIENFGVELISPPRPMADSAPAQRIPVKQLAVKLMPNSQS